MINVENLRVGNLVHVENPKHHPKLKGVILRVTSISQVDGGYSIGLEHTNKNPNTYYETYAQLLKYIEPISLSPERLIELGFYNHRNSSGSAFAKELKIEPSYIMGETDRILTVSPDCEKFFLDGEYLVRLYYLHDLQNLIASLTSSFRVMS